jgi:hypothetical protein
MKRSTKLVFAMFLLVMIAVAAVWSLAPPDAPVGPDRNVPGATTGPGRNSTASP